MDINFLASQTNVPLDFVFNRVAAPRIRKGKFWLFDVDANCYVSSYTVRSFGSVVGPLAGRGGEHYLLANGQHFWADEWIS